MTQSNKCLRDSDFWLPPRCSQTSINPYIFWIIFKKTRIILSYPLADYFEFRTFLAWRWLCSYFLIFFNRLSRIIFALKRKQRSKNDSVMFVVVFISLHVVGIYKIGCCAIYNIISVTYIFSTRNCIVGWYPE